MCYWEPQDYGIGQVRVFRFVSSSSLSFSETLGKSDFF